MTNMKMTNDKYFCGHTSVKVYVRRKLCEFVYKIPY